MTEHIPTASSLGRPPQVADVDATAIDGTDVLIAPLYGASIYFLAKSHCEDRCVVRGHVDGFHDRHGQLDERYRQRFVRQDGRYRVIHVVGSSVSRITEFGRSRVDRVPIQEEVRFDDLGLFTAPADPVSLVPLFPGRRIRPGEDWSALAAVKTAMGQGQVRYVFRTSFDRTGPQNQFLHITFEFEGVLEPTPVFAGGSADVRGSGWLIWNLAVNQRSESHIRATYRGVASGGTVTQSKSVDDWLCPRFRRATF